MKIILLIRSLEVGGTERQVVETAKILKRHGHEVLVCTFYPGGMLSAQLQEFGIAHSDLAKKSRWNLAQPLLRLIRIVRSFRPDILYSFLVEPNVTTASFALLPGSPKIIWGVRASNMETTQANSLAERTFRLSVGLSRIPALVIANSEAGRAYHLKRGYRPKRFEVIENFIDFDAYQFDAKKREQVRRTLKIGPSEMLIGHVGRVDPIKDQKTLMRAYQILRTRLPVRLLFIGSGNSSLLNELKAMDLDRSAVFLEENRGLDAYYSAMDVFVSSSVSEGFSNTLCEALACGTPAAVTEAGDNARIVADSGKVAEVGNSENLAEAIQNVLKGTWNRSQVRESLIDRFSPGVIYNRLEEVLQSIMK